MFKLFTHSNSSCSTDDSGKGIFKYRIRSKVSLLSSHICVTISLGVGVGWPKLLLMVVIQSDIIPSMEEQTNTITATQVQSHSKPTNHPERITQMQCLESNSELRIFFIDSANESLKYLPTVLSALYHEIELLVNFLEYRLTVLVDEPHPGDQLQNIRFVKQGMDSRKKILYLILSVFLPYLKSRLHSYLMQRAEGRWRDSALRVLNLIEKAVSMLNFINLSIFIVRGKYRSLTQRLLKIPMEFIDGESSRILNFSLMNRRILWNVYELFLKTVLPFASKYFGSALKNVFYLNSYMEVEDQSSNHCMVCHELAVMPLKSESCGHVGCYYCISSMSESNRKCSICGEGADEWKKMF